MTTRRNEVYWLNKAIYLANNRTIGNQIDDNLPSIGAILVRGRHQIASGVNLRKSHPVQGRWGNNKHSIFLHAEIATILNALRQDADFNFGNTTMYVGRTKKYLIPLRKKGVRTQVGCGLAKPCEGCQGALIHHGVKRVVYSTDAQRGVKWSEIRF